MNPLNNYYQNALELSATCAAPWEFVNRGHCNYYRAARIIAEMGINTEKMGASSN